MVVKVGILACQLYVCDGCPGKEACVKCFDHVNNLKGKFEQYKYQGGAQIVAFANCGGCPGVRTVKRAIFGLKEQGAEVIHIADCVKTEVPCPHLKPIEDVAKKIEEKTGLKVVVGIA